LRVPVCIAEQGSEIISQGTAYKVTGLHPVSLLRILQLSNVTYVTVAPAGPLYLRIKFQDMFRTALFAAVMASALSIRSQDTLSLKQALDRTLSQNAQLRVQEMAVAAAKGGYDQARASWLPQLSFSYSYLATDDPLNAFGFRLQQGSIEASDFDPAQLNDPEVRTHATMALSLRQPLFNLDAARMRKAQLAARDAADWQRVRTEEGLTFAVRKAYADFQFLHQARRAAVAATAAYEAHEQLVSNYLEQGLAKRTDLLEVGVALNEVRNRLLEIESNSENAGNLLSYLMGEESFNRYVPSDSLVVVALVAGEATSGGRSDLRAVEAGIASMERMYEAEANDRLPRLNAFGEYKVYGEDPVNLGTGTFMAGLQLNWEFFKGTQRTHGLRKRRFELDKARTEMADAIQRARLDVQVVKNECRQLEAEIAVRKSSAQLAAETKKILTDRFRQGLEKTVDVLRAEAVFLEAEILLYQAISEFNKKSYELEFITAKNRQK
jgi:outer membrane protein TolC